MRAFLFIGIIGFCSSFAQDFPRKELNLEKLVDEIFPIQDLDLNYEELYENLAQLLSNPIDLNSVSQEQLRALFVVTETNINSFLAYRSENGPLLSVYELQSVPGWDRNAFDKIIPFVMVYDSQSKLNSSILHRMSVEKNNYLLLRYDRSLGEKKGYNTNTDSSQHYVGTPDRFYMRYRVARSNDFSVGFTIEKDPGEKMTWSPSERQYGFDFISFHAQVRDKGKIKNLIVGDFQGQFGQGLILGSVFGFGKNSETVTTIRRSNLGFLPYSSLGENFSFSGAAGTYQLSKTLFVHSFVSRTFKDAAIQNSSDDQSSISSLSSSGLHRTPGEIQNRKQVAETDAGGVLQFKYESVDAGIIFHHTNFDKPVLHNPTPYNQFSYSGVQNQNTGFYLNFSHANFTFFTEVAQTNGHGGAWVTGLLGNITRSLELSLLYRNFNRDFYSFYSNAFSENSTPQNERGFYWGWKYAFNKRYAASGYMDLFEFPWLRYRNYAPSHGSEWLLRINYTPTRNVLLFLQAREETKDRNLSTETNLYINGSATKRNYWINCDYTAAPWFTFKSRAQFSTFHLAGQASYGFALIQDVNCSFNRWAFSFRYALFDTDDYDNRLYVYERDVWLAYSFPAYYGVGVRNYALVQYKVSKKVDLWFRWSCVRFTDREQIGSAGETIQGNSTNDIKFQARVSF